MRWPGYIGPTYTLRSSFAAMDRCVNLYPELNELQNQKNREIGTLIDRPPLLRKATLGNGPIRGLWATATGRLMAVSGATVYRVNPDWTTVAVGTLNTTTGPVSISDNGLQAIIVDGVSGYVLTFATGDFTQITNENFPKATRATFQDSYTIVNNPNTGQFAISALVDSSSWDGLDFATAEGQPDYLVTVISNNRQVWLMGTRTFEVWWNTGASDFPFSRIDGAYGQIGCGAAFSVQIYANTVAWLSDQGVVYMAQGFQPARISNHAVEIAIQNSGDFSDATAYSYLDNGHWFYVLNLPGASSSWVYDLSTGQWHERTSTDSNGIESKWTAQTYAFIYDTHVMGDATDGRIYALDLSSSATYSDDGSTITRRRVSPHLSADLNRIFIPKAQLDIQPGIGLNGNGQGSDPMVMLRFSRDGGFNWDGERWVSTGKIGNTRARAIWRRNGQGRDWVCEVKITDPVRLIQLGMEVQTMVGAS